MSGRLANGKLARAVLALVGGRPADADAFWGEAFGLAGQDNFTRSMATSQLVWLRRHQGRLAELEPMLAPGAIQRSGSPIQDATVDAHIAMALADLGHADAEDLLLRVVDRLPLKGGGWSVTFVASIAAIAAGSVEAAARLTPQLEPWSGRFAYLVNAVWFGPADRLLGDLHLLAGHTTEALRNYDRALAQIGEREAPTWTASVHRGRAASLTHLGRTSEAKDAAMRADEDAARAGLVNASSA